ncbi:TPA: ATP-dependent DNA helicase [Candidatus Acetothermia bacterium]|nr:ATP-dependent DNA helicase [Candidatus Acetothermia bacterium]
MYPRGFERPGFASPGVAVCDPRPPAFLLGFFSTTLASVPEPDLRWLDSLNPAQREAVTHGDGPLLVIAGAGTGKTRTLAYRVAFLISQGVPPDRILLLTFTRRAAEEMLSRAAGIIRNTGQDRERVWGGTFHATATRLLRTHAAAVGLKPEFTVLDQGDAEDLLGLLRHELGLASRDKRFPRKGTCLAIYSRVVNGSESLSEVLARSFPWTAEWEDELNALFKAYVARKQRLNVLDFDDLLLYWREMLGDEDLARWLSGMFDHILVDEYQDTNRVQARILRGMRTGNDNVTVVGDDAQSIYSFRAATVRNILDFPQEFPGTRIVTLEENYRSTTPILTTANELISKARERFTKNLWSRRARGPLPILATCRDEKGQDEYVAGRILALYEKGVPLRRQAVLFRAAHHSASLEVELARRGIPFHKYGGLRFVETAHIKDALAFLRIAENPQDELAWFRVLDLLDGVGPVTISHAIAHVAEHGYNPRTVGSFPGPAASRDELGRLGALFGDLLAGEALPLPAQVERVRRFYERFVPARYDNALARIRDLESLEQIASGYRSRRSFLTDLQLDPPSSTADLAGRPHKDDDWLVLSTIHSAKGCEWDAVYLIHAADGFLPSDLATGSPEEIEEELRLTYVALTRTKDHLAVVWPLRYHYRRRELADAHGYAQLCRFFTEHVRSTMEQVAMETRGNEAEEKGGPRVDLAERIRARWG